MTGTTSAGTKSDCLSASEVEALCAKAARGAGLEWGLAEEAGFAARWLFVRGFDGPSALVKTCARRWHLGRVSADGTSINSPDGGDLSPIEAGAALSDFSQLHEQTVAIAPVFQPILLLPFTHQIAAQRNMTHVVEWRGGKLFVHPNGAISGMARELEKTRATRLVTGPIEGVSVPTAGETQRPTVASNTVSGLDGFAMRTTVPSTAASRANAGASATDND